MGRPFPGITATVLDPHTFRADRRDGRVGLITLAPGLALDDAGLLNQPAGLRGAVPQRLVPVRRSRDDRRRRLLLVRRRDDDS